VGPFLFGRNRLTWERTYKMNFLEIVRERKPKRNRRDKIDEESLK
jgi:hypothetical protein